MRHSKFVLLIMRGYLGIDISAHSPRRLAEVVTRDYGKRIAG